MENFEKSQEIGFLAWKTTTKQNKLTQKANKQTNKNQHKRAMNTEMLAIALQQGRFFSQIKTAIR